MKYTIVGGNPFCGYTGTITFTSLRVVGSADSYEEASQLVRDNWECCSGLIMVLYDGKELGYNEEGELINPEAEPKL